MSQEHESKTPEPHYLVIACGQAYETRIAAESDLVNTIEDFYFDENGMDDEVREQWTRQLADDSSWEHDNRGNRTEFTEEFECERVRIVLLTGAEPFREIQKLKSANEELWDEVARLQDNAGAQLTALQSELSTLREELKRVTKERDEAVKDKETFQRRMEKALKTIDEFNEAYIDENI
jgi:hypothetical protein